MASLRFLETRGLNSWKAPKCCVMFCRPRATTDRKSTRLNSSHTVIYTLSLHDALPISVDVADGIAQILGDEGLEFLESAKMLRDVLQASRDHRSEEHTSELQSHRDLHSFPTRRSSDLRRRSRWHRSDSWRRGA